MHNSPAPDSDQPNDSVEARADHPYATLTPDLVLDALAELGMYGDGRLMALSSYENRVYQVSLKTAHAC